MFQRLQLIRFTPTLIPSLGAIVGVALTCYLGNWQQSRAAEKRSLQIELESRMQLAPVIVSGSSVSDSLKFRRAEARGQWELSKQILLDNKVHQGVAGYQVITPLRIEGTNRYLLVNRGWIPRATNYPTAPSVPTPPNAQLISGLLTIPSSRFLELGNEVFSENIWQNLTTERFKARTGLDVLPYVLYPPVAVPPLLSAYDKPNAGIEKHVEYMMTWYALAATIVILWLALNIHFAAPSGETNSIDRVQKRVSA